MYQTEKKANEIAVKKILDNLKVEDYGAPKAMSIRRLKTDKSFGPIQVALEPYPFEFGPVTI